MSIETPDRQQEDFETMKKLEALGHSELLDHIIQERKLKIKESMNQLDKNYHKRVGNVIQLLEALCMSLKTKLQDFEK